MTAVHASNRADGPDLSSPSSCRASVAEVPHIARYAIQGRGRLLVADVIDRIPRDRFEVTMRGINFGRLKAGDTEVHPFLGKDLR